MRAYGTVTPSPNGFFWSCTICSAVVVDRQKHDDWHDGVKPRGLFDNLHIQDKAERPAQSRRLT